MRYNRKQSKTEKKQKVRFMPKSIGVSTSLSPTIPTILTTRRSLPLSDSRRTKRMLSQKERVGTEGLAW